MAPRLNPDIIGNQARGWLVCDFRIHLGRLKKLLSSLPEDRSVEYDANAEYD